MENKSDLETILYYRKYNPFKFIEDISYIDFFDQLRDNFFNSPSLIDKLENVNTHNDVVQEFFL